MLQRDFHAQCTADEEHDDEGADIRLSRKRASGAGQIDTVQLRVFRGMQWRETGLEQEKQKELQCTRAGFAT
jgi:hypothetical protein